jgi:hypothetical protein
MKMSTFYRAATARGSAEAAESRKPHKAQYALTELIPADKLDVSPSG